MNKEIIKDLIKEVYALNPDGKGKERKRSLKEILDFIDSK
jgi:hypothetical protein